MDAGRSAAFASDSGYRSYNGRWNTTRSPNNGYNDGYQSSGYESGRDAPYRSSSVNFARGTQAASPFKSPPVSAVSSNTIATAGDSVLATPYNNQYPRSPPQNYSWQQPPHPPLPPSFSSNVYGAIGTTFAPGYSNGDSARNGHPLFAPDDGFASRHGPAHDGTATMAVAASDLVGPQPVRQPTFSSTDSVDDTQDVSPNLSDISMDSTLEWSPPPPLLAHSGSSSLERCYPLNDNSNGGGGSSSNGSATIRQDGRSRPPRRGANRDEFDGPHQYLPRPTPQYIASQERELPHLPTNLLVQEQDSVLAQVNDRLSQCAFDFVARYQFPIPLTQDMRPVARPQDREWTEWVQLLKRLATKRRIPARVLYNGQIKQLVTILENSLEMRHAARHQSRPLKDDRNILQLISAGIQVAKILKDAPAMDFLDRLYVATDKQIQERSASAAARFRS
ncbi:hypothetical protein SPI_08531 [Niveomyces insectorum RCEF 264]|uniref:Uncharacterized protein n=1 Tax=Niveomyces insectorum RCEF 264 TaxID=1081102 RepID=A0A167N214_9HYPO|nr:hypothetical protein SPI_08531 [Niveomyces insectorum RCEF 264]